MKKVFLLGAMACALVMMTANVSAQNVTESDIVGKWEFKEAQNFQSPNVGLYLHGEHAAVGETVFSLMRDIEFRPDGTLSVQVAVDRDPTGTICSPPTRRNGVSAKMSAAWLKSPSQPKMQRLSANYSCTRTT